MPPSRRRPFTVVVLVIAFAFASDACAPAWGWSTKEHILLTRLAAIRLLADPQTPPEMKAWLREAVPGLGADVDSQRAYVLEARVGVFPRGVDGIPFWAVVPDLQALIDSGSPPDRVRKVEPFGVGERSLHFLDVEVFMPDETRRRYRPDLSNKPAPADFPRDHNDPRYQRAGMLPFRAEQCYRELIAAIRQGRLVDKAGQFPRDEHASKWAGFLAHYLQDNTQPQHATEDYRSASYFSANPRGAPNVHADVEYRLVDDDAEDYPELRKEFWGLLVQALKDGADPVETDDLFAATVQVSLRSYDALPLIGQAAVAAYGERPGRGKAFDADAFYHFKAPVAGQEMSVLDMKARQMGWGVRRTQRVWLQAWREAAQPAKDPQPTQ
jgi:hypothetical protein